MAVITHGNIKSIDQSDLQESIGGNGVITISQTYTYAEDQFTGTDIAHPCPSSLFPQAYQKTVNITHREGGLLDVHCTWEVYRPEYDQSDPTTSGGSTLACTLEGGTSQEPLQSCKYYYDKVGVTFIDGVLNGEITHKDGEWKQGEKILSDSDITKMPTVSGNDCNASLTKECALKIIGGQTHYLCPAWTWTWSDTSDTPLQGSDLNVGKVGTPKGGAPNITGGYEWLQISANQTAEGKLYRKSIVWQLSSQRGWDDDVYG